MNKEIEKNCKDNNVSFRKSWRVFPTITDYTITVGLTFILNGSLFTPKLTDIIIFPPIVFVISILFRIITKPKGFKLSWT